MWNNEPKSIEDYAPSTLEELADHIRNGLTHLLVSNASRRHAISCIIYRLNQIAEALDAIDDGFDELDTQHRTSSKAMLKRMEALEARVTKLEGSDESAVSSETASEEEKRAHEQKGQSGREKSDRPGAKVGGAGDRRQVLHNDAAGIEVADEQSVDKDNDENEEVPANPSGAAMMVAME